VSKRVTIRVSLRAFFERNLDAAQNQFASGRQAMNIVPDADSKNWLKVEG